MKQKLPPPVSKKELSEIIIAMKLMDEPQKQKIIAAINNFKATGKFE